MTKPLMTCSLAAALAFLAPHAHAQPDNSSEVKVLQKQVEELKTAFEDFKHKQTQLAEALSNTSNTVLPVGSIVAFAGPLAGIPPNWKECDGSAVTASKYPLLWKRLQAKWGGTGQSNFKLPELRGKFLRGVAGGSGHDPGAARRIPSGTGQATEVASTQDDAIQNHKHLDTGHGHSVAGSYREDFACGNKCGAIVNLVGAQGGGPTSTGTGNISGVVTFDSATAAVKFSQHETTVKNSYVHWIIRVE